MGMLVDGVWEVAPVNTNNNKGEFVRKDSVFRNILNPEDAVPGRYHLYVSYACPWAHRTLIMRKLKGLEEVISFSPVDAFMGDTGWTFTAGTETEDKINGFTNLHQIYTKADPTCTTKVTVPILWDKEQQTIVNNESAELMRILNTAFNAYAKSDYDAYPKEHQEEIDEINEYVYPNINNGVYRCGFATSQECYDEAFDNLFTALNDIEMRLMRRKFLLGDTPLEADWRLFTTLLRFDPVYVGHFKCNLKRIHDYPSLSRYLQQLVAYPGIKETIRMDHIKQHYYTSHRGINPTGIVPKGPQLDF